MTVLIFFLGVFATLFLQRIVYSVEIRRGRKRLVFPTYRAQRLAELELGIGLLDSDVSDYLSPICDRGNHHREGCHLADDNMDFCPCECHKPGWLSPDQKFAMMKQEMLAQEYVRRNLDKKEQARERSFDDVMNDCADELSSMLGVPPLQLRDYL